jgi:hypothetical protein
MNATQAKEILDKIVGQVFGFQNPLSLEQAMEKFAFDIRLPQQVYDATTNQPTWAYSTHPTKFITMENARKRAEVDDWLVPKKPLNNLQDILSAWNDVNFTATERSIESSDMQQYDMVYFSQQVYNSQDVSSSRAVLFSDSVQSCEFVVAAQRSQTSNFCIRLEDSKEVSNSFGVSWSGSVSNSFFLHDCKDVHDSMFCSHISGRRFCIANMQFEEEEYEKIKEIVVRWILTGQ